MNWKYLVIIVAGALGAGYWAGSQFSAKSVTQTQEQDSTKKNVVTIVKEIVKPDGTKQIETTIVDRSKEQKTSLSSETEVAPLPGYRVSVAILKADKNIYQLSAERRLLGPYWMGVSYNTQNQFGLSLGMEF